MSSSYVLAVCDGASTGHENGWEIHFWANCRDSQLGLMAVEALTEPFTNRVIRVGTAKTLRASGTINCTQKSHRGGRVRSWHSTTCCDVFFAPLPAGLAYSLPSIQQSTYTEDVGGLSCSLLLFITRTRSILTTVVHDVCQPASVYVPDLPVVYYLFDRKAFKRSKRNYSTNPNRFDRLVRLYPVNNESVSTFENISKELLQPENHPAFLYVPILQFLLVISLWDVYASMACQKNTARNKSQKPKKKMKQ
jgi:hypothetical protein